MKVNKFLIVIIMIGTACLFADFNLEIEPKAGLYYDSNPFGLSGEVDGFPLEIEGDLKYNLSLNLQTRLARFSGNSLKPSFEIGYTGYNENTKKNYLSLQPKLLLIRKGYWITLLYRYIPEYAILPNKDAEDSYTYKFPVYASNKIQARSALELIDDLWLEGDILYQLNYFNQEFIEYDQEILELGVDLRYSGKNYAKVSYSYRLSDSRGYDTEGETRTDSDDTDGSYEQDKFMLSLGRKINKNISFRATGTYKLRYYTSEKAPEEDSYHRTRKDTYYMLDFWTKYDFGDYYVRLEIDYDIRNAESLVNPDMGKLRDYEIMSLGLSFGMEKFKLKIW